MVDPAPPSVETTAPTMTTPPASIDHTTPGGRLLLAACLIMLLLISGIGCAAVHPVALPYEAAPPPATAPAWTAADTGRTSDWVATLDLNTDALDWRLHLIDAATDAIDIQTFIWYDDPTGHLLRARLVDAADRGVRVRVLMDDATTGQQDSSLIALASHPNIQVRLYNPFKWRYGGIVSRSMLNITQINRLNHRMHNKLITADNRVAIIGGRNMSDAYFGYHDTLNFRDFDLIVYGALVPKLSHTFDLYWNCDWSIPVSRIIDTDSIPPPPDQLAQYFRDLSGLTDRPPAPDIPALWRRRATQGVGFRHADLLYDLPANGSVTDDEKAPMQFARAFVSYIDQAQHDLLMINAYMIPTPELEDAILRAAARGVRVRLLTNSLRSNDNVAVHSHYSAYVHTLLRAGVDVHEIRAHGADRARHLQPDVADAKIAMHSKIMCVDDTLTYVGSANMDPRSFNINTELGLVFTSRALNRRVRATAVPDLDRRNAWELQLNDAGDVIWIGHDETRDVRPAENAFILFSDWLLTFFPIADGL